MGSKSTALIFMRSRFLFLAFLGLSTALNALPAIGQTTNIEPAAVRPTSRMEPSWWKERHAEKLAEAKERGDAVELLFIGDSITHSWNKGLWAEALGKYQPFNLGFSGDRTEHVLWRIGNGALDNLSPKVTVLMIGTNNTGQGEGQPAEDTIQGIEAIIDQINDRLPDTKLIVHAVFPRDPKADGAKRLVNDTINKALPEIAADKGAEFLDINHLFLEKDGTLPRNIMPDFLHPNQAGYKLWARGLQPTLARHFGETKKSIVPTIISLWPNGVPQPHNSKLVETNETSGGVTRIANVSDPSITLYQVKGRRSKSAVLVCPGGGYSKLAWDKEGTEVAEWLNSIGITAAVLKYRTPQNREGALQDAQRALGLIRSNATEWNLDPKRIGVLGFSAGGHLAATLSASWKNRAYPAVDDAESFSCRPDFTVLIYPAYLGDKNLQLVDEIAINAQTPPAFIVQAQDDRKHVPSAVAYYTALHKAEIPAELHIFPTGGHGYGLRDSAYPVSNWNDLCSDWFLRR